MWSIIYPSMRKRFVMDGVSVHGMSNNPVQLAQTVKSNVSSMLKKKKPSKQVLLTSSCAVVVFVLCYMNSSSNTLQSIRRILCLENESPKSPAYVINSQLADAMSPESFRKLVAPPTINGRRPIPSHIEMCQAFLERREMKLAGQRLEGHVHVTEDEAVCTDWAAPHASMMAIFSGEVINQVSQRYGVTYSHDCQRTHMPSTSDGKDWKTIQEDFPPSGLVLDDGSVSEEQIVELCKGCMAGFNGEEASASVDQNHPNPSWFHPHSTRHCIMYPGTTRPLVNDHEEMDMAAVQEQRKRAQHAPLGKLFKTVEDRMKLAAAKHKLENNPGFRLSNGRTIEDEEEKDGVIIYLDEGSMPMTRLEINKHIPKGANVISIIISPLCVDAVWENDQKCVDYAKAMQKDIQKLHPDAEVTFEVSTSTAAAVSRMVRVKVLVCPPGTTTCLIPALAKEQDTFAVVGESMGRSNTEEFFDFVSKPRYNLHIANIDNAREPAQDLARNNDFSVDQLALGADAFSSSGGKGYVDGCVELRGRIGDWEQDFIYEDLATEKNGLLRGSSAEDTATIEANQRTRGSADGNKLKDMLGNFRSWTDNNPECELDMLNVHGLCEVVHAMKLGVVQFVGDEYTEEMVRSFWALLGIDDGDVGKVTPSTTNPEKYRKTVHCPKEKISFDVAFTPNEKLVDMAGDAAQPIGHPNKNHYVPVATPVAVPVPVPVPVYSNDVSRTGNYQGPGVHFAHDMVSGVGYTGGVVGGGGAVGGCWGNPYGAGCGCNNAATMRSATPPPPPPMPQFNPACHCVPFQQQYQYNYATAAQPQPAQRAAQSYDFVPVNNVANVPRQANDVLPVNNVVPYPVSSGRQVIVGAVTPNQSYDQYVQSVDQFGRTITNVVDPNDIVILRTGAAVPQAYGGVRKTQKSDAMTQSEIEQANNYLHRAVEEYRRRTRQGDLLSYDPAKSKLPYVHVLDVAHMTHNHPLSTGDHRDLAKAPNLYDHWNHLLYSNLRDMAKAELARNSAEMKTKQQGAPPGSPYENNVPLFPSN